MHLHWKLSPWGGNSQYRSIKGFNVKSGMGQYAAAATDEAKTTFDTEQEKKKQQQQQLPNPPLSCFSLWHLVPWGLLRGHRPLQICRHAGSRAVWAPMSRLNVHMNPHKWNPASVCKTTHFPCLKSPLLSHTVGNRVKLYCVQMLQSPSLFFVFTALWVPATVFFFFFSYSCVTSGRKVGSLWSWNGSDVCVAVNASSYSIHDGDRNRLWP